MNNIIFTDIDGVLNPSWKPKWCKKSINIYNKMCIDFNLKPVITSTWRLIYPIEQLQEIFIKQGITIPILDYTPNLKADRGIEIQAWLDANISSSYIIVDDKVSDITPYISTNVIKCCSYIGINQETYNKCRDLMK